MMVLIKTKDGKKALLNTKATSIREYEEEGEEPPTYGLCTLTIPAHAYFCLYRWSMSLSSLFRMFTNKGVRKGPGFSFFDWIKQHFNKIIIISTNYLLYFVLILPMYYLWIQRHFPTEDTKCYFEIPIARRYHPSNAKCTPPGFCATVNWKKGFQGQLSTSLLLNFDPW